MTLEIIIVFIIVFGAVALFAMDKMPVDLSAIIIMAVLLMTGIISPEEGISGFSNTATITVGAMFVLSAGLFKTGALNFVGIFLSSALQKNLILGLFAMMGIAGLLSAFINDTAVVALFMPIVIEVAKKNKISPTKLLMPLSFGALFGGVCTLIGTSTNILVNSIAEQHGKQAFGMFEMTPFGIIILAVGILYMVTFGVKLIKERRQHGELVTNYEMNNYITEIILTSDAKSVNKKIKDSPLVKEVDIDILEIHREEDYRFFPDPETILLAGDVLKVRCDIEKLKKLQRREGIRLKPYKKFSDKDLNLLDAKLVEAVVTPNSKLRGRSIKGINFRETFGATVLAIRQRGQLMREKLGKTRLLAGDVLLIEVKKNWLHQLRQNPAIVILSEVNLNPPQTKKIVPAILIISSVVVSAALGIFPIVSSAIIGAVLMILTKVISLEEAYRAIDWKVIFLLAGVLTLGVALEKTGGAALISKGIVGTVGFMGERAIVSAFFFLTIVFTNFMSNNATAALLAPIAILTADSLGVDSRPFIMAVTYAASLSIMTPVGYQTNLMILGPGNYRFFDFIRVGTPLDIIFWILATLLIPFFFPF